MAQDRIVTGTVIDEKQKGIAGVNVMVKGTSIGTAADADGKFSIAVGSEDPILIFSFIGYRTREIVVGNLSVVNVGLDPNVEILSELVVVGYGVQYKKDVTGAIATVDTKELNAIPTSNIENNFQGRLAGVNVISSGEPGSNPLVIIRGASTFAGSSQPLYMVDGVPTLDISTLNPSDVESVTALKDAGAASIYGSRAANGVIVITTKRGKSGSLKLSYNGYFGWQFPGKGMDHLLDPQGYADLNWLAFKNSGETPSSPMYGSGATPLLPDYYVPEGGVEGEVDESKYNRLNNQITRTNKAGTNWYDEISDVAPIQNHDISISGGSDNSNYYVGLNYFDQNGIVVYTEASRYSLRINTEFNVKDKIRIGENITNTYRSNSGIASSGIVGNQNSILDCFLTPVILPVYDIQGNFTSYGNWKPNPYANQFQAKDNKSYSVRAFGNIYAEVDFLRHFMFRTAFGGSMQYGRLYNFFPTYKGFPNEFTEEAYDKADWNWQNTLTFKKILDQHSFNFLAGIELIKTDLGRGISGARSGYYSENPDYWTLNNGGILNQRNSGYVQTPSSLTGYFGRIDYSYRDRYLLSVTARLDGSSKFINNRYGTFPSATLAWRISNERFLSNVSFIDDLKLRAGYGIMGDQINASPNNSYTLYAPNPGASYYDIGGTNFTPMPGLGKYFTGNPNGQWQQNETTNIGLDFSFFNSQLGGSVDVFKKVTDKLLYTSEQPGTNGTPSPSAKNVGEMENKGIEVALNYNPNVSRNWKLNFGLIFTSYVNRVIHISNNVPYFYPMSWQFVRIQPGHPISAFYGFKIEGLWQSQEEIDEANALDENAATPFQQAAKPGRLRYHDVNGDGKITLNDDRTFIGNPNPDFSLGFNLSATYKNFDLTLFLYSVYGNDIFNGTKTITDIFWNNSGGKSKDLLYRSWTPDRRDTSIPIVETTENFSSNQTSSYFVEDGSYLRIKNVQIGYRLPAEKASNAGITLARVYVQAVNPLTFTKFSGLDPEVGGSSVAFGSGGTNYPASQQVIIGLNLEF